LTISVLKKNSRIENLMYLGHLFVMNWIN
jgi:hypothetical protein